MWKWDQGRLLYFEYESLRKIARVLVGFDGVSISSKTEQFFRDELTSRTGLPFSPADYTIKRNYSRVFQCGLLGSFYGDTFIATDACRAVAGAAGDPWTADEYMTFFAQRFSYSFPAFKDYSATSLRVFPAIAMLKLLIARQIKGMPASLTPEDIFFFLIGPNSTGVEDLDYYIGLAPTIIDMPNAERRQIRELMIFVSQFSFLHYYNSRLFLDRLSDSAIEQLLQTVLCPATVSLSGNKFDDLISMGKLSAGTVVPSIAVTSPTLDDMEFIEGDRRRREHIKIERSPLLRQYYMYEHEEPICDACAIDMSKKYPWTDFLLEIHHLLPLASAVRITTSGTSLDDVVGLCPSCHRAIHSFYRCWLNDKGVRDFSSRDEAVKVYDMAKREIK